MAIAYADVMTGMNATTAILAALYHRERTGRGQFIDAALLDTQVAALWNIGQNYLTSGETPRRMGNAHATIVPYEAYEAADGWLVLAVGNDRQFADFCAEAGAPALAADPRFTRNADRVRNRDALAPIMRDLVRARPRQDWLAALEKRNVPCGPVNTLPEVFADPQVAARGMTVEMRHPASDQPLRLLASPLRLSATPVTYRHAPPTLGQHTDAVLEDLGLDENARADLRARHII
jgi:crotonobetainyl-CoA:carnitine CoA-transferase CaiB-like acyl-CoA transferase